MDMGPGNSSFLTPYVEHLLLGLKGITYYGNSK